MVDLNYLKGLVEILSTSGVTSYRDGAIRLEFAKDGKGFNVVSPKADGAVPSVQEFPIDESILPPDLRHDEIMKQDNILFYSTIDGPPGVVEDPTMPLTGEVPL